MTSYSIIGPRGIPKEFMGTSGLEAYIESKLPKLVKSGKTTCYVRSYVQTTGGTVFSGANIIPIFTIRTKHLDTIFYSLVASIYASLSSRKIVWYHGAGPAIFAWIPRLCGKQVYTTIHAIDWKRDKWNPAAKIFLLFCEKASVFFSHRIYVVSINLKKYFLDRYAVHTILDKYIAPKSQFVPPAEIVTRYGLRKNMYILYMGRFVPEKRIEWLIKAGLGIKIPIVLAGGESYSATYTKKILRMSEMGNIIVTNYVFGSIKQELISNCRLLVLPSRTEGYPISIADAVALQKDCIVGDFLRCEYPERNPYIHFFKTESYVDFKETLLSILNKTGNTSPSYIRNDLRKK